MSDHDLSAKLAQGMRRAKQPSPADSSTAGAIAASSAQARERALAATHGTGQGGYEAAAPESRVGRFAEQSDQAPPASLDRPWDNLHPKRIWPD